MRWLIDGHLDLAWNALSWGRDITLDLDRLNRDEVGMTDHPPRGRATTTLPEMRRAGIAVWQATLLARAKPESRPEGRARISLDFVGEILARHGHADSAIDDIFHGNWLRFFRKNLPS